MIDATTEQAVLAALMAAREAYQDEQFLNWAGAWISGHDRTQESAAAMAKRVRRSAGDLDLEELTDKVMRSAGELVEEGMDPELAMDFADVEYDEAMREPPAGSMDREAEYAKTAGQCAWYATQAAEASSMDGVAGFAAGFAELACGLAARCKQLRDPSR